jgi:hypothetical protein
MPLNMNLKLCTVLYLYRAAVIDTHVLNFISGTFYERIQNNSQPHLLHRDTGKVSDTVDKEIQGKFCVCMLREFLEMCEMSTCKSESQYTVKFECSKPGYSKFMVIAK